MLPLENLQRRNLPGKGKKRSESFRQIKKEEFKKNKLTGHPSLPISRSKQKTRAIGFTHDIDFEGEKVELIKNIDPNEKDKTRKSFAKLKIEEQKSGSYKTEPRYKNYRIAKVDRKTINAIKQEKYK